MLIPLLLAAAAPQTQADLDAGAGRSFQAADAAMNAQYRATMAHMRQADAHPQPDAGPGPSYAAALLAAQRAWLAFRDAECLSESYKYRGGSMAPLEALACKAALTRARTAQLRRLTVTP